MDDKGRMGSGRSGRERGQAPGQREGKVRATFHLPWDLLDELRNAVVALSGPPLRLTLSDMTEAALRKELKRLQRAHNKGRAFPRRSGKLRGGRPIGS